MKEPILREILVVHHSHTDWGYTSHPLIVEQLQNHYLDQAVSLCRDNPDRAPTRRYRWTCESSWVVHGYLRSRSRSQRRHFIECVRRGDIEVTALPLQPTALADGRTIAAALGILDELRDEGVPVSVALCCDINGLSWPWADALLEAGVRDLATAMNFVCGGGMMRWTAFHWKAASGRKLLCWQGTHYNQGAYWGLNHGDYSSTEVASLRIRELLDYPYEKVLLQVTNIPPDNMGPNPRFLDYLRDYNRLAVEQGWPRMRAATLKEWFGFLSKRARGAPTYEGDWSDWWSAGVASTPRATAALMEAQRRVWVAERRGGDRRLCDSVRRKLFVAAEHTWGASSSMTAPFRLSSLAGLAAKQNLMYEAAYAANDALRQSLRPRHVMHDENFESFDPFWRKAVQDSKRSSMDQPLRSRGCGVAVPDWDHWVDVGRVQAILERPANGSPATWFEVGKFNRPESHGRWPSHSRWKRWPIKGAVSRRIEGDVIRFEARVRLESEGDPCALYVVFPFRLAASGILADVGGAWADPRKENVPESCHNWWTVHQGVLMSGSQASLLWTSWDAPLVMFDGICPNPPKRRNRLRPPVLVAWAFHNYWGTNFPVLTQGQLVFRFRIKFWPRWVDPAEAERFCESDPLAEYPRIAPLTTASTDE